MTDIKDVLRYALDNHEWCADHCDQPAIRYGYFKDECPTCKSKFPERKPRPECDGCRMERIGRELLSLDSGGAR